ncbi:MAG TPA: ribosome biogenesis factor YjgA [Gammaproteobacteria bacterium]
MPRKRRKGYYVDGCFVAEGSAEDARLRAEAGGAETPSRTARKRASLELQAVGERLVDLTPEALDALPLPEVLRDAVVEARRLTSFGARRRQLQYIGKLMRRLDAETLAAARAAVEADRGRRGKPRGAL